MGSITRRRFVLGLAGAGLAAGLWVLGLSGCASTEEAPVQDGTTPVRTEGPAGGDALPKGAAPNEILTLSPVNQEKELVTIHFEYGLDIAAEIEKAIEEHFTNVEVVMVHDGASDSMGMLTNSLKHGAACDLIFSRSINTDGELAAGYLLNLADQEFVNNFYLTSLDTCVQADGGLYFLPGPANIYGVIYDKTVLDEHGWKVPTCYSEFVELIQTIDAAGLTVEEDIDGEKKTVPVRAIRPSLKFTDAFRSLFYPFAYQEVFAGKENLEWLTAYQLGTESMVGHMEPFADILKRLYSDGVVRLDDWDYMPRYRLPMLCSSHSAVMICGPLNTFANETLVNSDHEYAFLPIFAGDEPGSDYLYSIPAYFMAINGAAAQVGAERRQLLLDIMSYICDPAAQEKLFGESNTLVSNIKGVTPGQNGFNAAIQKTIREGRIITDFLTYAEAELNAGARDMLTGKVTVRQWLQNCDASRDQWLAGTLWAPARDLGVCTCDLTRFEVALMVGQTYRDLTGADYALVYVNKGDQGVNCQLFEGPITSKDANNVTPDRTSSDKDGVACGTLSGQQIMDCLNGTEGHLGNSANWFFVASGLNVEFAPWMPAGKRLLSCTLPDGSDLDPQGRYKVAFMSDKLFALQDGETVALRPDDIEILEGKWPDLFATWLDGRDGVLERPEQTCVLNWMTEA